MPTIKAEAGETIFHAARRTAAFAKENKHKHVYLIFNELEIVVYPDSNPADTGLIYQLLHEKRKHERLMAKF